MSKNPFSNECDYIFKKGKNKGLKCGKDVCSLHSGENTKVYSNFINLIISKSHADNTSEALLEWYYWWDNLGSDKCLCGFSRCDNVKLYKNKINGGIIAVGSICQKHLVPEYKKDNDGDIVMS